MPNTHSRISLIPVCKALAIDVPQRNLSAIVLYSHKDTDKIIHTRERSIPIRRMTEGHLPSDVRRRWDDGFVQQQQTQSLACLNFYNNTEKNYYY